MFLVVFFFFLKKKLTTFPTIWICLKSDLINLVVYAESSAGVDCRVLTHTLG